MYITCQECDTIFRLDERRLKPTGSKVRCSQCGNTFVVRPLETASVAETAAASSTWDAALNQQSPPVQAATPEPSTKAYADKELEGIDLAELDSILEQGTTDKASEEADLELDFSAASQGQELAELDDGDLDLDLDFDMNLEPEEEPVSKSAPAEEAAVSEDFEDLDLDMDFDLDEGGALGTAAVKPDTAANIPEAGSGEAISLDEEDLAVEPDEAPPSAEPRAEVAAVPGEDLEPSLDDLEMDLDLDEEGAKAGEAPGDLSKDEELELDLDFGADEDQAQEAEPASEELELDLDDTSDESGELSLEMETEAGETDKSPKAEVSDDLDLSDLDDMLGSFDEEATADEGVEEDQEMELSLESQAEDVPAAAESAGEEELEELEFELDAEVEDKPIAQEQGAATDEDEEIDLSDIEELLEGEGLAPEDAGQGEPDIQTGSTMKWVDSDDEEIEVSIDDEIDLTEIEEAVNKADSDQGVPQEEIDADELDLDLNLESSEEPPESEDLSLELEMENSEASDEGQDLSLDLELEEKEPAAEEQDLDLELDLGDEAPPKEADDLALDLQLESEAPDAGDEDFGLDLELESDQAEAKTQDKAADDDEFDLSDFSDLIEEEKEEAVKTETIDTGDIELEFQIEEDEAPEPVHARVETETMTTDFSIEESIAPEPEIEKPAARPRPVKKKQGTSKGLIFILLLVLLGGAGYFGYDYMVKSGIEIPHIPYVSDYLNPKPKDPNGVLALSTMEINGKFIENEKAGRLFVITGKVRNGYPTMRGMIRLQGKLFSTGKKLAKSEFVYAGLNLSDQELGSLPVAQIKQQLSAVPKAQDPGAKVRPNQAIGFMVVFNDLPDNLDEYAIEMVSSAPVQ